VHCCSPVDWWRYTGDLHMTRPAVFCLYNVWCTCRHHGTPECISEVCRVCLADGHEQSEHVCASLRRCCRNVHSSCALSFLVPGWVLSCSRTSILCVLSAGAMLTACCLLASSVVWQYHTVTHSTAVNVIAFACLLAQRLGPVHALLPTSGCVGYRHCRRVRG
jgi:hypothetical protein